MYYFFTYVMELPNGSVLPITNMVDSSELEEFLFKAALFGIQFSTVTSIMHDKSAAELYRKYRARKQ